MRCPHCDEPAPPHWKTCPACRTPLESHPTPGGGDLYALLIAIDNYENPAVRNLKFAVADVLAVRELLRERMALADERCLLLACSEAEGGMVPRRAAVLRSLEQFTKAPMGPQDTFILYFAGHGFAADQVSYLLTLDSDPASSDLLEATAVSLRLVKKFVRRIRAGQQLMILDACRNEARDLGRSGSASEVLDAAMARDIKALAKGEAEAGGPAPPEFQVRSTLSACWEGQQSYEYLPGRHSWFCHHLLARLREYPGEELAVTDLAQAVAERMRSTAWREFPEAEKQRPYVAVEGCPVRLRLNPLLPERAQAPAVPAAMQESQDSRRPAEDSSAAAVDVAGEDQAGAVPPDDVHEQWTDIEEEWTSELGICFRLIRPGRFALGARLGDPLARPDEQPPQTIRIERPFRAATFPLTNAVVRRFVETASAKDSPQIAKLLRDRSFAYLWRRGGLPDELPAVQVSAEDAEILCGWMGGLDGRRYRLPTEAEWEYVARAGTGGAFWWSEGAAVEEHAVFATTGPVPPDARRANPWGLVDTLGNVAEWTSSVYDALDSGEATQAYGSLSNSTRAVRGGSWRDDLEQLRVCRRLSMFFRARENYVGIRVVCDLEQQTATDS